VSPLITTPLTTDGRGEIDRARILRSVRLLAIDELVRFGNATYCRSAPRRQLNTGGVKSPNIARPIQKYSPTHGRLRLTKYRNLTSGIRSSRISKRRARPNGKKLSLRTPFTLCVRGGVRVYMCVCVHVCVYVCVCVCV